MRSADYVEEKRANEFNNQKLSDVGVCVCSGRGSTGYVFELNGDVGVSLRSKILTSEEECGKGRHSKHGYKVFAERGLYMLATILKNVRVEFVCARVWAVH